MPDQSPSVMPPPELTRLFASTMGLGHVPQSIWRRWWSVCLERAACKGAPTAESYLRGALVDADERGRLLQCVVSGHTRWLRDEAQLLDLVRHLGGRGRRRLRVWSAGCSTGEEPLSLLSLLKERGLTFVDILATDVSKVALEATALASHDAGVLVRVMRHDVVHESPPETGFDAILCRNVLMYYEARVARAAVSRLTAALSHQGRIFLSASDVLGMGLDRGEPERSSRAATGKPEHTEVERSGGSAVALLPPMLFEGSVSDLLCEAESALRARDLGRAGNALYRAEALDPNHSETQYLRGVLQRKLGNGEAALESFRRATFLDPSHWAAFVLLADEWRRAGNSSRADAAERQAARVRDASRERTRRTIP